MRHWFDGLAMLHRFTIDDGRVSYGNRFLRGPLLPRRARARQHRLRGVRDRPLPLAVQARADACSRPGSAISDNANVNVDAARRALHRDDRDAAAGAVRRRARSRRPSVAPYEAPGQLTTAHPHLDRASGGMLNYAAKLGPRSSYRFFGVDPDGARSRGVIARAAGHGAGLHALLRPHRALDRAGRVPVRGQPARAGALAAGPTSRTTAGSPSAARASR